MLVLCPFPEGVAAGQRLKYEQYFDDWRAVGFDITVSPFMDRATWTLAYQSGHHWAKVAGALRGYARRMRDLFRIDQYELVYVFMWVTPFGSSLFERIVRARARRLLFDLEDYVLVSSGTPHECLVNPVARFFKGGNKARYLVFEADHVITSSPALNDHCLTLNRRRACSYISSSVDSDRFIPVNRYRNDAPPVIGWTGTFSTRVYLDLLRPVFQVLAKRRDFRLRVIGNFEYELPGVTLEVIRWTAEREAEDLQGIDIGVYPLIVDEWVTGKSGLKAIQYMAFGLPCVATEVGNTPNIIRHGENGLLVRTEDQWLMALEQLIDQPAMRRRLGEQARRDAVANYSTKAVAADYRAALASAMEIDADD